MFYQETYTLFGKQGMSSAFLGIQGKPLPFLFLLERSVKACMAFREVPYLAQVQKSVGESHEELLKIVSTREVHR